tara:strand:- start:781 stop:1104 length:324 start_codon:yes stop_codon:yes gene_type:complete
MMKFTPTKELHIHSDQHVRDEIPGVPPLGNHRLIVVFVSDYQSLKTLHIVTDDYLPDATICGRWTGHDYGDGNEVHTLYPTGGFHEKEKPNTYLICNKCIAALKAGE